MDKNWIEQYWTYMVSENFEKAMPLKTLNFPKSFFKYRNLSERTIDNLKENYIWLADISSLNDPFECAIQFDNDKCLKEYYSSEPFLDRFRISTGQELTKKEIKSLVESKKPYEEYIGLCKSRNIALKMSAEQQLQKIQRRWTEIVDEATRNLRICSFSTIKDSLLLWSHYSDDHKGICIEYDFEDDDLISAFIQPVLYSNEVNKIGLLEEYSTMRMICSSLIKFCDWEYEQEWRLTIFKQKEEFPRKITVPLPKAIYLGTRFNLNDKELKDKLMKIVHERKIPIYQMDKHPNEFRLMEKLNTNR
jgi:hypothetical protein